MYRVLKYVGKVMLSFAFLLRSQYAWVVVLLWSQRNHRAKNGNEGSKQGNTCIHVHRSIAVQESLLRKSQRGAMVVTYRCVVFVQRSNLDLLLLLVKRVYESFKLLLDLTDFLEILS